VYSQTAPDAVRREWGLGMRGSRSRNAVTPVAVAAIVAVAAGLLAGACASPAPSAPTLRPTVPTAPGCVVGASWNSVVEGRIHDWDSPRLKALIEYAGGIFMSADAKTSPDTQSSDIDSFVAAGARIIVVRAQDTIAILPALHRAEAAGVSVIAYDRLIEDPKVLYMAYDTVEIGRLEARAILAARPTGNYVIIKGDRADPVSDQLASGIHEILQPAVDRGDIHIVGETYTHWWDPADAQTEMAGFLAQTANRVDAVIAENDGMAGAVRTFSRFHALTSDVSTS
jgi:D-xylose transport system substrate-binding protein